jgi:hypothetical protein
VPIPTPGAPGTPLIREYTVSRSGLLSSGHLAGDHGVGDDPGELRRHGDQKRLFALVEAPPPRLLHHQHAEHFALVNDRHPEKGVEGFLADVGQQTEVGMQLRVLEVDRLLALGDQAHQALAGFQGDLAHQPRIQALGGAKHIALASRSRMYTLQTSVPMAMRTRDTMIDSTSSSDSAALTSRTILRRTSSMAQPHPRHAR